MKKAGLFLAVAVLMVLGSSSTQAQTVGDYRSAATGNWSALATWQRYNGVVAGWATPTAAQGTPTSASGLVTIRSANTVTVNASYTADQVTVSSGGQLTINSGSTLTIANGASTDLTIAGAVAVSGTIILSGTTTIQAGGAVTVASGGILQNSGTVTTTGSLTFASGGTYKHSFTNTGGTVPTATWSDGSTCSIVGYTSGPGTNVAPGGLTQSFYNFTWNCPNQTAPITMGGDLATVRGDLTIISTGNASGTVLIRQSGDGVPQDLVITGNLILQGGNLDLDSGDTQNHAITLAGSYNQTGGTFQTSGDAGITFNFTGANKTFTQSGGTFNTLHSNFVVTSGASLTLNNGMALVTGVSFNVNNGGTLNCGTSVISGVGTFTLSSGGTLGIGSTAGITSSGATGNIQTTLRTYSSGGNYTYNGAAAQACGTGLTGTTPTASTVNNLTISNTAASVTLSANVAVTGTMTVNSSALFIPGATVVINTTSAQGTITGSGTIQVTRIAATIDYRNQYKFTTNTLSSMTVDYAGAGNQTINSAANVGSYGALKTSGSGTKTLEGAVTVNNGVTVGSGTTLDASATNFDMTVGGDWTNNGGTFNPRSATVTFNKTTAGQAINGTSAAQTFNKITVNKSGQILTVGGSTTGLTLNSDLTITAGTFSAGTATAITVKGNWSNSGTYTKNAETVTFNGASAQSIGGSSATAFAGLTLSNTLGLTLSADASVSAALTLTLGDITTGAKVLTQSGTSAGNGDVVGNVFRGDLVSGATKSFGNPNVQIRQGSGDLITSMTVTLVKNFAYSTSVKRTYTLSASGVVTTSAKTVRLHYLESERNSVTTATIQLFRGAVSGSTITWNGMGASGGRNYNPPPGANDNWVETTTTGFSPWTLGGPNAPTAVEMVAYGARAGHDGKTLLQWETGREVDNLGFNIYREEDGKRVRINKSLIVGSGLMASPGTVMTAGRAYAWQTTVDQARESVFWIEEIDLSGYTVWHGPISSQPSDAKMSAREQAIADQTVTLSDMATESTYNGVTRPVEAFAKTAKPGAVKTTGTQLPINPLNPPVKIRLKQEGWYRVGQPQLVAAGLNPSVNPNSLQLFADGVEVPISVITNNGAFDSTSAIEFYGLGIDSPSTDTHVYSLMVGSNGLRIPTAEGRGGLPPSISFLYTVERKDRSIYLASVHNGDAENFFGTPVGAASVDQAITLKNVDRTAAGEAAIEVVMQGFTNGSHLVTVSLNGNPIGTIQYNDQAQGVAQFQVPNRSLAEGQNLVTLASQQGGQDISLVDHIRVSYWHSYAADGNALKFTASENQEVTLSGFSGNVRIFDVTDPLSPSELAASVNSEISPVFLVTVAVPGTGVRTLLAIGDDQTRSPLSVISDKPSSWKSKSNAADLVIITHDSLLDSYKRLQTLRQSQGLKVALVDVEDLYDEFNSSNKSPQAIKDFLAYARSNWKTAPKYVLLAGSASYDPKNYNGFGQYDLVPTKLIDTLVSETASDDWFADFDMDGIAEMAVGRLPTPTSQEAQTTVMKLAVYDNSAPLNSALLVADGNRDFDFEAANDALAALFPASITVQKIDRGQIGTAAAKQQLLDGIASGQKIVNYVGHGSPSIWRDNLFTSADALALTNTGRYPLVIAMSCLNGEFHLPQDNSLATALMNSREGGAIAVWASSALTVPAVQAVMNQQFYSLLFQSNQPSKSNSAQASMTLGEITKSAKLSVSDLDVRRSWILFGDPSMKLK